MIEIFKSASSTLKGNAGVVGYRITPEINASRMKQHVWLFHQTPLFRSSPGWQLRASFIEGLLFLTIIHKHRLDVFPPKNMDPDDIYIGLIPFTWTAPSNKNMIFASPESLYSMMMVSVFDYQADEFIEAVAGLEFATDLPGLVDVIQEILALYKTEPASPTTSLLGQNGNSPASLRCSDTQGVEKVKSCLRRFVSYFLEQRRWYESRKMPYFHWIRSNDEIACPITSAFVACLVPYLVRNPTVEKAVIACQHKSTQRVGWNFLML